MNAMVIACCHGLESDPLLNVLIFYCLQGVRLCSRSLKLVVG